jgi:hypothetical protein
MKQPLRYVALLLAILALCLPIGLMGVLLLDPLWLWLEATWGIEAVGHGGPAPWCYAAVYFTLVIVSVLSLWIGSRRRDRQLRNVASQR